MALHRPHRMRRMHRICEQHRFISGQMRQQVFIRPDERRLLGRIELARREHAKLWGAGVIEWVPRPWNGSELMTQLAA